jgi:hypothetical protein
MPRRVSAWNLRNSLAAHHGGSRLSAELYEWFVAEAKTLSYEVSGTLRLLTKPEKEAIRILKFADARLKGSKETWKSFVEGTNAKR